MPNLNLNPDSFSYTLNSSTDQYKNIYNLVSRSLLYHFSYTKGRCSMNDIYTEDDDNGDNFGFKDT